MTATWYLVRHIPDLRRREPRNVGVILRTPDGWLTKFLGQDADGSINGRHLPHKSINTEVYKTWVNYFNRKASDDQWADVHRMQSRRVSNFLAEEGGELLRDEPSWRVALERLYAELVATDSSPSGPSRETPLSHLLNGVKRVLSAAGVDPDKDVEVPAQFSDNGPVGTVPFRFQFENGQPHLMDLVHKHSRLADAAADARELRARVEAARRAHSAESFVSFYSSSILGSDHLDDILLPLDRLAYTVDVDIEPKAIDTVQELMAH